MGTRLLVIDDSPTIRKAIEIALRGRDWNTEFVANGHDGVTSARTVPPEAIILDYVLPDMRGIDVCERLAADPRTAGVPILIVSGKGDAIRDLFRAYGSVVGCLNKPFSAEELHARLESAVRSRAPRGAPAAKASSRVPNHLKEAAAKAIFAKLSPQFAQIPAWLGQLNGASPAAFFARKILTPQAIEELLESLLPVLGELTAHASLSPVDASAGAALQAQTAGWPTGDLLALLGAAGRTGCLEVEHGNKTVTFYWKQGSIVLATSRDPNEYLSGSRADLAGVDEPSLRRAETEQKKSGKPTFVTLVELGSLPAGELTDLLYRQSRRLVLETLEAVSARFRWTDAAALPGYVDAYGRHVSTARDTLLFGLAGESQPPSSASLEQLALERARAQTSEPSPEKETVFSRTPGFSDKVRKLRLSSQERRVLGVVDAQTSGEGMAARTGFALPEVLRILGRLTYVDLIRPCDAQARARDARWTPVPPGPARSVMILEPDVEGFQKPLESLLQNRPEPMELISLHGETDVLGAIRRRKPRLVILNAAASGEDLEKTARGVRHAHDLSGVSLVAVLDPPFADRARALEQAGFDAVLIKPIAYVELERLMDT